MAVKHFFFKRSHLSSVRYRRIGVVEVGRYFVPSIRDRAENPSTRAHNNVRNWFD